MVKMADLKTDGRPLGIATDHGGVRLRDHLLERMREWGLTVENLGTDSEESVDYPDFAAKVAQGVAEGLYATGVLVCGTGLGMSMMANRFRGVRAAVCTSGYMARMTRAHNDANILCLGERVLGFGEAEDILQTFLLTGFEGGRHQRRIGKLDP